MKQFPTASVPVVEVAIEPQSKRDQEKLGVALSKMAAEDPSLQVATDDESGQVILKGTSEQHLNEKVDMLRRVHRVDLVCGAPQIAYREKLTHRVEQDYTHRTQTDGTGQFARVKIIFEPNEVGRGNAFASEIVGGAVPVIPGVELGINSVMQSGILAGFPLVDTKATLIGGDFHDSASSPLAFEIAARAAFREALQRGGSVLLEPVMNVEVETPDAYTGSVIGDLISRRGQILSQGTRGDATIIAAKANLSNLFGYGHSLRSLSEEQASFTMTFDHYAPVGPLGDGWPPPAAAAALRRA